MKKYIQLYCSYCLMEENGCKAVLLEIKPVLSHGSDINETHEKIEEISYDYKCRECKLTINYKVRLYEQS